MGRVSDTLGRVEFDGDLYGEVEYVEELAAVLADLPDAISEASRLLCPSPPIPEGPMREFVEAAEMLSPNRVRMPPTSVVDTLRVASGFVNEEAADVLRAIADAVEAAQEGGSQ
jgi:hypothetical protein